MRSKRIRERASGAEKGERGDGAASSEKAKGQRVYTDRGQILVHYQESVRSDDCAYLTAATLISLRHLIIHPAPHIYSRNEILPTYTRSAYSNKKIKKKKILLRLYYLFSHAAKNARTNARTNTDNACEREKTLLEAQ